MIFPPNAPVLGHVFWKYFRKFLNQQAFKFLQTKIAMSKKKKIQVIDNMAPPRSPQSPVGHPKGCSRSLECLQLRCSRDKSALEGDQVLR